VSDPRGVMLELPIHTEMVPFWRMLTSKRVGLQQKSRVARSGAALPGRPRRRVGDFRDYLRLRHPMKFDFCRMTLGELTAMVERAMVLDAPNPSILKPMVAIGHTKDLLDLDTIESFLAFLKRRGIPVHTFASLSSRWATLGYLGENRDGVSCPAEQPLVSIPS